MPSRSFRSAATEPVTFDVDGVAFAVPMPFPVGYLVDFAEELQGVDGADTAVIAVYKRFMELLLGPEQWPVFHALRMDMATFADVVQWLVVEISGRPTTPPSGLPDSSANGGRSSTDERPLLVSTSP